MRHKIYVDRPMTIRDDQLVPDDESDQFYGDVELLPNLRLADQTDSPCGEYVVHRHDEQGMYVWAGSCEEPCANDCLGHGWEIVEDYLDDTRSCVTCSTCWSLTSMDR